MPFLIMVAVGALLFGWIAGIAEISGTPDDGFASGTKTTWLLLVIFLGLLGLVVYILVGKKHQPSTSTSATHEAPIDGGVLPPPQGVGSHVIIASPTGSYWCTGCDFRAGTALDGRIHVEEMRWSEEPASAGPHVIESIPGRDLYTCRCKGCNFSAGTYMAGQEHVDKMRRAPTPGEESASAVAQPASLGADGFEAPRSNPSDSVAPSLAVDPTPPVADYKICPDCAEEVRAAARKCRFCGFQFQLVPNSVP
jgi:hypothetical protein